MKLPNNLPKLPYELTPTIIYGTSTEVIIICDDSKYVNIFYWDGESTTYYKYETYLKVNYA